MKMKKLLFGLGIVATMFIVATNLQYALDDYGLRTNSLHSEILAQSTTGTATGTATTWWESKTHKCVPEKCTFSFKPFGIGWENEGITHKCKPGDEVAHCWSCSGCDAPIF